MTSIPRKAPHSVEVEEYLLSCCLLDGAETLGKCVSREITPAIFCVRENQIVFAQLIRMLAEGKEISLVVLVEEMHTSKQLEGIGGYSYLLQISNLIPTPAQLNYFIEKLLELHALREAIRIGTMLVEDCYVYSGGGVNELIAGTVGRLVKVTAGDGAQEPSFDVLVDEALAATDALISANGVPGPGEVAFPWPAMTAAFGPMKPGELVILAARPSIGKSSLARPIAAHASKEGHSVYFDTLEVKPVRVVMQIAAMISGIGLRQVAQSPISEQNAFKWALKGLRGAGITMSRRDKSLAQIVARAKAMKAQRPVGLMVIDHGILLSDVYETGNSERVAAIGRVTKTLKHLAGEINAPILLLWQLNRASEKESNREPMLSDLRDSGSLEEDADKVIFIHRPKEDPLTGRAQEAHSNVAECPRFFQNVIQAKGRDDGTALMSFYFERATTTFIPARLSERP